MNMVSKEVSKNSNVLELRIYRIDETMITDWVRAFDREVRVINESNGAGIMGAGFNAHAKNEFIWIRSFPDHESREVIRSRIYDGDDWLNIQDKIRGMLDARTEQLLYPIGLWSPGKQLFQSDNKDQINEIRIYEIAEGRMEDWLTIFQEKIIKLHNENGVFVGGLFRTVEESNKFIWFRSFDDEEHRKIATQKIYQGKDWKNISERVGIFLKDYSNMREMTPLKWFE